jgi:amidase
MSQRPPRAPSTDRITRIAADLHMDPTDEELEAMTAVAEGMMGAFARLEDLTEPTPPVHEAPRCPGERVPAHEDPLNAWVTRCRVAADADGPLSGVEVALKDNVSLAGVEMTCGSTLLSGFVPRIDATVVRRLLDAGATITGKTNMEALALSASGELSDHGAVLNPADDAHLAGGSSSGSAAVVATEEADVAIGTDQAGSIRIPASWSGVVGHKPTRTLVPYTGIAALGHTFDHVGPLASSVRDAARVLDVVAGKDDLDPRQGAVPTEDYEGALERDPSSLTVGVLAEGFDREESDPGVDETVRDAIDDLGAAGATVEEVSVPQHLDGEPIFLGFALQETTELFLGDGLGYFGKGFYDTDFADAFGRAMRSQADDLPPFPKLELVLGTYLKREYRNRYHAKAQNLRRDLRAAYDDALADVDVLAMPTTPMTAHEAIDDRSFLQALQRSADMIGNTAPFDVTGHPAVSVPCGETSGLPVGVQFVGGHFEDATVLAAADVFERSVST